MEDGVGGVAAILLAAGASKRMGQPKLNLPWGDTTVLGQAVRTLARGGAEEIVIVTGPIPLEGLETWGQAPVRFVANPDAANGEMLSSVKCGLAALKQSAAAVLIALGDMPSVPAEVVSQLIYSFYQGKGDLIIPSYQMRRGHPWLVSRALWSEILSLRFPQTMRDFLSQAVTRIVYLNVASPGVLQDLDTPDDYQRFRPNE